MKARAYAELVAERKACRACPELENPAVTSAGRHDSDRIGPYSRWQGNLDAELVVVAQDFADTKTFEAVQGWPGEKVSTNLALVELAAAAGLSVSPPKRGVSDDQLFFTNAVLCLKRGKMQARIPEQCFRTCGRLFLRRTIELVAPRAVAALGAGALDSVLAAFGKPRRRGSLIALIEAGQTFDVAGGVRVFPLCHPSPTVRNTTRSFTRQKADWACLGRWLQDV